MFWETKKKKTTSLVVSFVVEHGSVDTAGNVEELCTVHGFHLMRGRG